MPSSPRIEPTLLRILTALEGIAFTRDELLERYREHHDDHGRNARASWQFIDRNLLRLSKFGILMIQDDDDDPVRRYVFGKNAVTVKSMPEMDTLAVLRQKLQQQRIALLTTLGETEAYDDVCAEMPQLQRDVQAQYDDARDRSVKLLGRIRVLESLIASQESGGA